RRGTNDGAATSAAPNAIITPPAHRRPRADSHHTREVRRAMGGISGRMYCGRFDCETEKKTSGMRIQRKRKMFVLSRFSNRDVSTTTVHGNAPNSRNGTKYHGGPVLFRALVASRCTVSVTST